jgi:hypothetical protein
MSTEHKFATLDHPEVMPTEDEPVLYAVIAEFKDVTAVTHAAEKCRDRGFKNWDVHTPFPIHGIDAAMGTKPTILPWLVLCGGLTGFTFGLCLTGFTNAADASVFPMLKDMWSTFSGYPFLISGKPTWSFAVHIPVMFECTVLFSALTTVFGTFLLCGLPMHYNPLFKSKKFQRVTDDRFFVVIYATDPQFNAEKTARFLETLHPESVEAVEE